MDGCRAFRHGTLMQGSLFDESDPSLCRLPRTTSRSRVTSPQSRADEGQHLGDPLRQRWRASVTLRLTTIVAVVFCSLMGFIAYFTKAELERQFSGSLVVRANRVIDAIESVQPNLELPVFLSVYRDYLVLPPDTAVNPRFADLKLAPMSDLERQAFATDRTTDALDDDKRYTLVRPAMVFDATGEAFRLAYRVSVDARYDFAYLGEQIRNLLLTTAGISGAALALLLGGLELLVGSPLRRLTRAARTTTAPGARLLGREDEIGALSRALRIGQSAVAAQLDAERRAKEELEHKVRERTAELTETNRLLREEMAGRARATAQVEHLVNFDPMTDLPNRTLFADRMSNALAMARRDERSVALMLLNIDNFKGINDLVGHEAGDHALTAIARRMTACVRSEDTVARLSGDEFAIIQVALETPDEAAQQAQRVLDAVASPLQVGGDRQVHLTGTIGIATYPRDGNDLAQLQRNADHALAGAKARKRNTFRFFDPSLDFEVERRSILENELRGALVQNEFCLHYQPKIDLTSWRVIGAEALIRWRHPTLGMLSPDHFIGVAERIGLINEIGAWVLNEACRQTAAWRHHENLPLTIAVNVSAEQFKGDDVPALVDRSLAKHGLEPSALELEITESVVMEDVGTMIEVLRALHDRGVVLSIDDFGTGYSSLSYLRQLPVDKIKVDRSFVADIPNNLDAAAIARAIVGLGQTLNRTVIAEGVETAAQSDYLCGIGCGEAQGYYFSRPVLAPEFARWVTDAALPPRSRPQLH